MWGGVTSNILIASIQAKGTSKAARGELEAKQVLEGTMHRTMAKAQGQEVDDDDDFIVSTDDEAAAAEAAEAADRVAAEAAVSAATKAAEREEAAEAASAAAKAEKAKEQQASVKTKEEPKEDLD